VVDILWAEDSVQDQHLIRAALDDLKGKAKVAFVEDGQALLDRVQSAHPRLVVLDIHMPRMSGIEALQRLRETPSTRDMPVIVFTSSNHPQDVADCQRLDVVDFVTKPIAFEPLCAAVGRITGALRQRVTA
jgi:two-component system, OmpR family, alkaline phosphatase synthesis response regulator PhoP